MSQEIYGPPIPTIKGRTRAQTPTKMKALDIVQLPKTLYDDLKNVGSCIDFHYVNGIAIFHSISKNMDYRTVSFPQSRSKRTIISEMKTIKQKYHGRGFRIINVYGDIEFEKVENDILPMRLHCCGVDEHVPEVERFIQTQKNENRSLCHAMPYKCIPKIMVREILKQGFFSKYVRTSRRDKKRTIPKEHH